VGITSADIRGVVESVTRKWTKQRKAEERGRRTRDSRRYVYSHRVCFTDVAERILPGAYLRASGNGHYTVSKRQFFYSCRNSFREMTGRVLRESNRS
jgi:hypothetical protein